MDYRKQFYLFLALLNKVIDENFSVIENVEGKDANIIEIDVPFYYDYDFVRVLQEDGSYQVKKINKQKNNKIFEKKFQNVENLVKDVIKKLAKKANTRTLYKVKHSDNSLNFMYYINLISDNYKKIYAKLIFLAEKQQ